jgi:hypothetical protein
MGKEVDMGLPEIVAAILFTLVGIVVIQMDAEPDSPLHLKPPEKK